MLAVDISNFTDPISADAVQALKDAGVGLAIIQAVDPPAGYPAGKTREQIQTCVQAGMPVDAYIWLWFSLGVDDIQQKLELLNDFPIRELWLDVEDTASINYDQATCETKVQMALDACDIYHGGQPTGIYTGRWFWADRRYMGNTTAFAGRELWDANYDDVADAAVGFVPYGGWTAPRIKQYRGTTSLAGIGGLDLNVLSVDEAAELGTADPPADGDPCAAVTSDRNGLVSALGYLGGDALAPVVKQKSSSAAVRTLIGAIRGVCDQHGIAHA